MPLKVVITDCPAEGGVLEREILSEIGAEVERAQCRTAEEVLAAGRDADALLVCWAPVPAEVIRLLRRCRFISLYTAGYNNVDLEAASARGIAVAHNPDYCFREVAAHALSFLLAANRKLFPLARSVEAGAWDPLGTMRPAPPLYQQVIGILGFGRVGRQIAEWVRPLAGRVLVCDPIVQTPAPEGIQFVSFEKLLAESDYLSIHVPLNDRTRGLLDRAALARMKPGAYLINTSRGPLVDEAALADALRAGRLGGAALDVFSMEPLPPDHAFRRLSNVILTPHAAWYSAQSEYLLRANAANAVLRFFKGEPGALLNERDLGASRCKSTDALS